MKKGQALLSFLVGFSVVFMMALTTDQIIQKVYDSVNTALRVNLVAGGGGGATSITSGVTTITGGTNTVVCFDNAGVIDCGTAGFNPSLSYVPLNGSNPQAVLDLTSTASNSFELGSNDATNNSTARLIPSTSYLYDLDAGLILGSAGGAIRFFTNGTALANEMWDITTGGNLLSTKAGVDISMKEGTAPSGASSQDILYADSTAHRFKVNVNNGGAQTLAYSSELPATPKMPIIITSDPNNFTTGTTWLAVGGNPNFDASANNVAPVAVAGTFKHLACWTSATAQTASKSETITLDSGSGGLGPSCVINSTSTCNTLLSSAFQATGKCCEDNSGTATVAAGASVALKFVGANTPNVGVVACQMEFDNS